MTEREKLACAEMKIRKAEEQKGLCYVCGRLLGEGTHPQLAHRIKQSYADIVGKKVIHHALNMALVCSLECNSSVSLGAYDTKIDELVKKIRKSLRDNL